MNPVIESIPTRDGARVAVKRYPGSGPPVIFVHGLAVNADIWDIPTVDNAEFHYRSLPALLAPTGADIWLVNLRGHGAPHMRSEPPAGQDDWCVDHFILCDLPAVMEHVWKTRGRRMALVGASMGAMTLSGVLQGARLADEPRERIIACPAQARRMQEMAACAVFLEFPAALRWPTSLYNEAGELQWEALQRDWASTDPRVNYPFELLARSAWVQAILDATGQVRLDWMRTSRDGAAWWQSYPRPVSDALRWGERAVLDAARSFSERFKGARHFNSTMFTHGLLTAVDHMKAGVLRQMGKSVRARGFLSGLGEPDHDYTSGYPLIETPSLVIVGGRDRIANADVTREVFFDRIASTDKRFELYDELAHGEIEYAPIASESVYPLIAEWITQRS